MAANSAVKAIDIPEIVQTARKSLLRLLEATRGKKNIVIEKSLAGTVGLIVKFSTLQEYGVDRPFFLENSNVDYTQRNIIFLVRGNDTAKIRLVAEQIKLVRSESRSDHEFTIIWVPRRTLVSNMILEEHGVLGEATILEWPLGFIPLENDLVSLELSDSFVDLYLKKDPSAIFASAKALMSVQKQTGLFPRILGKGDHARQLAELLVRMRAEEDVNTAVDPNNSYLTSFSLTPSPVIENLIIIDREVDLPTALSTGLTYEALIDELFGIDNNTIEVSPSVVEVAPAQNGSGTVPTTPTKRKVVLDSSDKLYPDIRDSNFATVGPTLNRTARKLKDNQQDFHRPDQSISELKGVVQKLSTHKAEAASLKIHTSLAEEILKFTRSESFGRILEVQQNLLAGTDPTSLHENIEELIAREADLTTVLRLLCLESCLSNGLRQRDVEHFRRLIVQAYGFQHELTLSNLEKMGLLVPRDAHRAYLNPISGSAGVTSTDWNAVRKALQLWTEDVREADPDNTAFVFSGYAPLSVRLVQCVLQKPYLLGKAAGSGGSGWKGFEDVLSRVRGATVDVSQKGHDEHASHARQTLRGSKEGPKTSIVFFLGGITHAEVAALRFLSRQLEESGGRKLVIATTGMISGKRVIAPAVEARTFGGD